MGAVVTFAGMAGAGAAAAAAAGMAVVAGYAHTVRGLGVGHAGCSSACPRLYHRFSEDSAGLASATARFYVGSGEEPPRKTRRASRGDKDCKPRLNTCTDAVRSGHAISDRAGASGTPRLGRRYSSTRGGVDAWS